MQVFFLTTLFVFGLLFGSFASVLIYRIRSGESGIMAGRSHCPICGKTLSAWELIPLFSYIGLRGKCAGCKTHIPLTYPLLELATGTLFALSGHYLVHFQNILLGNTNEIWKLAFFLVIAFVTIVFVFYDLLYMEIPDEIMIPGNIILFGLLFLASVGISLPFFGHFIPMENAILNIPLVNAMLGGGAIFLFFYLQILVSNGEWMGGGDLRIALFMGLVAGFKIALLGLMLSYFFGSIIGLAVLAKTRSRNIQIPFGPYLALGLYTALFYYQPIIDWYMNRMMGI